MNFPLPFQIFFLVMTGNPPVSDCLALKVWSLLRQKSFALADAVSVGRGHAG